MYKYTQKDTIGSYNSITGEIERGGTAQGFVFKDYEAFQTKSKAVCYIAELDDEKYTYEDFLRIGGSEISAQNLFEEVDWQHPETLFS